MCLSIPAQVLNISDLTTDKTSVKMGKVSVGGISKDVSLALIEDVQVGDYVLVHAGFALSKIDNEKAQEVFSVLKQLQDPPT